MENIKTTCAFTGHRPEKLNIPESEVKKLLCHSIENAIHSGYTNFITGMAKGVDIWAAEIVLTFKDIYPHINLICALPYPDFADTFPGAKKIFSQAARVHSVMDSYAIYSYQKRNEWMVDNSSLIIALYTGEAGGTRNTVKYAEKKSVKVINILENPES